MHILYVNIPLVMTLPDLHLDLANPKKLRSDFTCFHILAISCFTFTGWILNLKLSLRFSNWAPGTGFRHQIWSGNVTTSFRQSQWENLSFKVVPQGKFYILLALHSPI
jgi:hypothetical protein